MGIALFLDNIKKQLQQHPPLFIGEETAFRSAVVVPLVERDGKWHILFQKRALSMRKQPGDSSFPGGKIDVTDASPMAAALRETNEELGVDIERIQVIEALSPYIASPTFVVYPFVVVIDDPNVFTAFNRDEVEEVFTIPLKWLLQYEPTCHLVAMTPEPGADFPFEKIANGEHYQWGTRMIEEWFYEYEERIVWGLTAHILKHFLAQIK